MVKVRNNGSIDYTGTLCEVRAGETVEVSEATAAYLTSPECPGDFGIVEQQYIPKVTKGRKVAE